jgi:hypothetical protein
MFGLFKKPKVKKESYMRFRHYYMGVGSLLVLAIWMLTDPDLGIINSLPFGGSTLATIVITLKVVIYVAVMHLSRKALFDYINMERVFKKAITTADGSGKIAIAMSVVCLAISILIFAAVH